VLYKIKRIDLWVARQFIKSKYISLVNLLADAEVFPEYLTWRDVSDDLVRWALAWLDDSEARARATASLVRLRHLVAQPGASDRAAERIVRWLEHREGTPAAMGNPPLSSYHGPHELGNHHERADQAKPQLD
jgi:lipid-A-disaccharide synthase